MDRKFQEWRHKKSQVDVSYVLKIVPIRQFKNESENATI